MIDDDGITIRSSSDETLGVSMVEHDIPVVQLVVPVELDWLSWVLGDCSQKW
jgi:hypothetical protein